MFAPLPTPREMAAWDQAAVDLGLPETLLMENAALAALRVLIEVYGRIAGKRILLFMGAGNNGGDAACLARHAHDAGAKALVLHTRPLGRYKGAAGMHLRLARRCGACFLPAAAWPARFRQSDWLRPDIVVDGLLGTGFSGALREQELHLVEHINLLGAHAFVFALDVPSGLNGLNGLPCPIAVRARLTATFAAAKPGLVLPEAGPYTGLLRVCAIGMPRVVRESLPPSCQLMTKNVLTVLPDVRSTRHKADAGHVLVAGGSPGLCGAPYLAARGALRAGAGLVTVAGPEAVIAARPGPEYMTLHVGAAWDANGAACLSPLLARVRCLVCGPGLGREEGARAFLAALLRLPDRPVLVLDADALILLAEDASLPALLRPDDILTPHPGEAAALLGCDAAAVQADRLAALARLQRLAPCLWVLKGAGTWVGRQGDAARLCPIAAPNLAVAGSGDVLAGCLGALIAQGVPPHTAACAGVLLHAHAGLLLAKTFPRRGNSASDIADALPAAGSGG